MAKYFDEPGQHRSRAFAPVAPFNVLRGLVERHELGYYNLILAHNVAAHPKEFMWLAEQRKHGTWFIDNSVIELGRPVDAETMYYAWQTIWQGCKGAPSDIVCVLPDELLDWEGTLKATANALVAYQKVGIPDNLMFVPQGKTWNEIIMCAEHAQDEPAIRWIGVAKNFRNVLGTRKHITQALQSIFPRAKFHMLGFSRDLMDDLECVKLPGVEGIDSSMPLRLTEPISWMSKFPKRGDWWKESLECTDLMAQNCQRIRTWLGG